MFNDVFNKLVTIQTVMKITFPQAATDEKRSEDDESDDESDDAYDEDGDGDGDVEDSVESPRASETGPSLSSLVLLLSKMNSTLSGSTQENTSAATAATLPNFGKPARMGSSSTVSIPLLNLSGNVGFGSASTVTVGSTSGGGTSGGGVGLNSQGGGGGGGSVSVVNRINALQQRFNRKNRFNSTEFTLPNAHQLRSSTGGLSSGDSPDTSPEVLRRSETYNNVSSSSSSGSPTSL